MTRPVRHAYLTWSSEPHERVGDARELNYVTHNKKATYYCILVTVSLSGARRMSKWLSTVDRYDNARTVSQTYLGLSSGLLGHLGHCLD
jgi:hypothetical protein